jgi:hypothetical protein
MAEQVNAEALADHARQHGLSASTREAGGRIVVDVTVPDREHPVPLWDGEDLAFLLAELEERPGGAGRSAA